MLINILIGVCSFSIGIICGSLLVTSMILKVDKLFTKDTGISFAKWVLDTDTKMKKEQLDIVYAKN